MTLERDRVLKDDLLTLRETIKEAVRSIGGYTHSSGGHLCFPYEMDIGFKYKDIEYRVFIKPTVE